MMQMKATLSSVLLVIAVLLSRGAASADALTGARQLLLVTTAAPEAVEGRLQRYERVDARSARRSVGEPTPVVVGRNGLAWGQGLVRPSASAIEKKEGDGKAPEGVFALGTSFGYDAKSLPGARLPYLALTPGIECVDDPTSRLYNRVVSRDAEMPDWSSSERMNEAGDAYRWGIVVDHNHIAAPEAGAKPVAGRGSCIFLHVWAGPGVGTSGCTAMAKPAIEALLAWLDPAQHPLLVQLTRSNYLRLRGELQLP